MKKSLLIFLALLAIIPLAEAKVRLPSDSFKIEDLEKAKTQASEENKPISILYTDEKTTCGLCESASNLIIKELKSDTIIVYVDTKKECPKKVSKALSRKGKYKPKVVVYDSSLDTELGLVIYENIKKHDKKAFKALEETIRQYRKK